MSAKLFKCTPEQLPGDLKANLLAMLQCGVNALEGYIRPGCLHLTLNAMIGWVPHLSWYSFHTLSALCHPPPTLLPGRPSVGKARVLRILAVCRTATEKHLSALDVRGLFEHLVASSNKNFWSSETVVVRTRLPHPFSAMDI